MTNTNKIDTDYKKKVEDSRKKADGFIAELTKDLNNILKHKSSYVRDDDELDYYFTSNSKRILEVGFYQDGPDDAVEFVEPNKELLIRIKIYDKDTRRELKEIISEKLIKLAKELFHNNKVYLSQA